jgi:hypothetical protein
LTDGLFVFFHNLTLRQQVSFVVDDEVIDLFFLEEADQFIIGFGLSGRRIDDQNGDVRLVEHLFRFFNAERAQLPLVVDAGVSMIITGPWAEAPWPYKQGPSSSPSRRTQRPAPDPSPR